jgi:hypothetical protein
LSREEHPVQQIGSALRKAINKPIIEYGSRQRQTAKRFLHALLQGCKSGKMPVSEALSSRTGRSAMMMHIQYRDDRYDYVHSGEIGELISRRAVKQIYRPGERRWVSVDLGPVRGMGGNIYVGPERRRGAEASDADIICYA